MKLSSMMNQRRGALAGAVIALSLLVGAGCGGGPSVSGFSVGSARFIGVDETLTVKLPLGEDGTRLWRVSSFDSAFLTPLNRQVVGTGRSARLVITARTRLPGTTELEIVEVLTPTEMAQGMAPRTKKYKIEIVP